VTGLFEFLDVLLCVGTVVENVFRPADEVYHAAVAAAGQVFGSETAENSAFVSFLHAADIFDAFAE